MKKLKLTTSPISIGASLMTVALGFTLGLPAKALDLLQRYPTTLTSGLLDPGQARAWQLLPNDVFKLTQFSFSVGSQLKVETGPAELGIGHCATTVRSARFLFLPTEAS